MTSILKRSLIFASLLIAGLVFYVAWFSMNAERFDKTAIPYLHQVLPVVAKWQYSTLEPLLSAQAKSNFESTEGQATYQLLTRLGKLESIGKPQYIGDKQETSRKFGDVEVVFYKVPANFETGPALIKINLVSNNTHYFIHHIGIQSEVFSQNQ